ncbi:hypothetical protein C0Z19_08870 [Trinickia soli]|uniref:Uncharacterized protein n=1 Tax=Trinickia soli TaxID=380675 RepID=A0A2N7W8W3_9BURK|nr:hypothetical protein C0Z19_08870 [Trinickia soli]
MAEAKKNRQARWRFFGNSGSRYALTPLSIRQRTEMPKEVKVKLRGHDGGVAHQKGASHFIRRLSAVDKHAEA